MKAKIFEAVSILLLFTLFIAGAYNIQSVSATVTDGYLDYVSSDDFKSTVYHPLGTSYLPTEGGKVLVNFRSSSGTGQVTIWALSDAFKGGDTMLTKDVSKTDKDYTFELIYLAKPDIDDTFTVTFKAYNYYNELLGNRTVEITVWSSAHIGAADRLYRLKNQLSFSVGYPYMHIPNYESPEGKANYALALDKYTTAYLAYSRESWESTISACETAQTYLEKADIAENDWMQSARAISDPILYLLYLLLVVAALIIVFLIVAIGRKMKPTKATTTS